MKDISNRFGSCITDGETLTTFSKGFVPANTKQNTQWAMRTFEAWSAWRNGVYQDDRVPSDVLTSGESSNIVVTVCIASNNLNLYFVVTTS